MRVCDQLESQLVDRESVSTNELTVSVLRQETQQKDSEIHKNIMEIQEKDGEIRSKSLEIQRNVVEIQRLTTALHDRDDALETLKSEMSKLQMTTQLLPNKVCKQYIAIHYHYLNDISGQ